MKTIKTVDLTVNELAENLKQIKGVTFANVTYIVDLAESKTLKGVKMVQKQTTLNITIGASYEAKVNRIQENKQDEVANFVAMPLKGKTHIGGGLMQSDVSGEFLLNAQVENHSGSTTTYFVDGFERTVDELIELDVLTPSFFKKKESTMGRGAVNPENNFGVITPKLSAIQSIKLFGEEFKII
jgi:hypothetical protein